MKIEALKNERIQDFVEYCKRNRANIDETFLSDEELRDFKPDAENLTYIVTDQAGEIKAAASLIIDDYYRRGKMGRFRILHSEIEDIKYGDMLMQSILNHTENLDKVNVFAPVANKKFIEFIEGLRFTVERYSFLLVREDLKVPELELPEGYEINIFRSGIDEEVWCAVRNAGFAKLQGSEIPKTPEQIADMMAAEDNIEGGAMILYHNDKPVGLVRGTKDDYEGSPIMCIGPLAIIPEYQGRGLGRDLLRASLRFAKEKHYKRTILCVNAENERAKALYLQEGFKPVEEVICYKYSLSV